ncbi:4'-phosphopantetheinyl transferase superfamily protein [Amycolatopsis sp. Hca4]|uniref:4'-phosphopantetheinyl transferase family protein n=1 Tax=Amycolatopsis sp. Hca4 TaxID=2742131 RepID=UPI0015917661|nr:4'-phosphopantetheinyl transferase superfamily protein [Amycolatopsis sp. Hca4]QKV79967.1 4'-phosphopantetheinyl transferase superfamily protein [Amycolatopsis sp. Hca4]
MTGGSGRVVRAGADPTTERGPRASRTGTGTTTAAWEPRVDRAGTEREPQASHAGTGTTTAGREPRVDRAGTEREPQASRTGTGPTTTKPRPRTVPAGAAITASGSRTAAIGTGTRPRPVRTIARPRPGEVDFWLLPIHPRPAWRRLLDDTELARADRLAATPAGDVFTASRALQRLWAAAVLGVPPAEVVIDRSCEHCGDPAHGRPRLAGAPAFSVSHTARFLLLAVAGGGRIGVDLEEPGAAADPAGLAGVVLSPAEHRAFVAAPPAEHPARLLTAWTRKEAAMKLAGLGLAAPPARVDVRGPLARSDAPGWPREPVHLRPLPLPGDHLAAVATTVPISGFHRRDLAGLGAPPPAGPPWPGGARDGGRQSG